MKGLELLTFLTKEQKERIALSEQNYKRFARIFFTVVSVAESEVVVKVWQMENHTGKYLTSRELVERGKEVFADIPESMKLHFRPVPFKVDSLDNVDASYVLRKMEEHSLQMKDLVKLLNIDKSTISRTLSAEEMTKSSKAMFYYLFKYLVEKHKTN